MFNLLNRGFIRFLLVGGLNTVFGYSMFSLFIYIHFHYSIATLFSTVLGVLFNFKTIGKLVFKNSNNNLLLKFVVVYTVIYLLNICALRIFSFFQISMFVAGAVLALPLALVSFVLNKKYVFKES